MNAIDVNVLGKETVERSGTKSIAPPNAKELITLTAPFDKGNEVKYNGNWNSLTPLEQPINLSAEYVGKTKIKVNVTVEINSELIIGELVVYGGKDIVKFEENDNVSAQRIYITYDKDESKPVEVYPYILEFEIPNAIGNEKINTLEVYLWNDDPKTSRGTETAVQPGTGPSQY